MSVAVDIVVEDEGWPDEESLARLVEPALAVAARHAAADLGRPLGETGLAVAFSDDDHVRVLNRDFRGKDKPTNVLSFPAPPEASPPGGPAFLGDVVLARQTVAREAAETGIPETAHVVHLAVHGFLHLLGYDHETDAEAERMEHLETAILAELGLPDPHAPLDEPRDAAAPHRRPGPG